MGCCHREPPLSQMLEDPLTRVLMASDGVEPSELKELITEARQRIAETGPERGDGRRG